MGTPEFAVGILESIIAGPHNVLGVITATDKPAGRGRKLKPSPVKITAQSHQITVWQPENLKETTFIDAMKMQKPDLFVVVAFRMLPKVVWSIPKMGTFNLHASLLPEYRGAAPINWAIINGESLTGITTFFINEQIDTGHIIDQTSCAIDEKETASELHDKLLNLGKRLVDKTLNSIALKKIKPIAQATSKQIKTAPKLNAVNTRIDWAKPAVEIERLIRGLNAYPAAWSIWPSPKGALKIKIYSGDVTSKISSKPGKLVWDKKNLWVHTADFQIAITQLQFPGKKKMKPQDLLNGFDFGLTDMFV